ncbi:MAG: hypothetical protein QOD99_3217 [Chthoniobacter sp.]|jgi:hypothetical protein|nr:hypothetical protein [Chthoniobacter sp.]
MPRGMKRITMLGIVLCSTSSLFAADRPAISARQALEIAENDLTSRNLTPKLYVVSLSLERPSMFGGATYWMAKWSEAIPASKPENREIGLKVKMDGTPVRLVKEPH